MLQLLPVGLPQCGVTELPQMATHRWHPAALRLGLPRNGMAVEDRLCWEQEAGLWEVLSGHSCWASHSVLSTHSSSALARLFPQSPPKLNEANSDASRETTHAQSGSESSSQETAPKKGRAQLCTHLRGDSQCSGRDSCGPIDRRGWPEVVGGGVGSHALLTRAGLPRSLGGPDLLTCVSPLLCRVAG